MTIPVRVTAPVVNQDILDAVRKWEDGAFRNVLQEAREGLREQISSELARGVGPRQIAEAIKADVGRIGLTAYDEKILANARADLEAGRLNKFLGRKLRDKRFDKTLARGKALTPDQIERMLAAYRRKLVAFRSETFARTSALSAANDAQEVTYRKAVADGAINASELRRYWVVARDELLCARCEPIPALNPTGVSLDADFLTPFDGLAYSPPLHPACRCTAWYRVERAGVSRRPAPGTRVFSFA